MIVEVLDPDSGAILFKKDEESLSLEALQKEVVSLKDTIKELSDKIAKLESIHEKDSN